MPNLFIRSSGTFTVPNYVWVRTGNNWVSAQRIFVRQSGSWVQTYPESGSQNFTASGSFVVPRGVKTLTINMSGGGGGGGGGGTGSGSAGAAGHRDSRSITVIPGETISITIGSGGEGGRSAIPNCGSNAATWFAVDADLNNRRGRGQPGFTAGSNGSGSGCPNSFNSTAGWAGGGGGSSSYLYSGGRITAGGGAGGNSGASYGGNFGTGGAGGNSGSGNSGASGAAGGAGRPPEFTQTYGGTGTAGFCNITW